MLMSVSDAPFTSAVLVMTSCSECAEYMVWKSGLLVNIDKKQNTVMSQLRAPRLNQFGLSSLSLPGVLIMSTWVQGAKLNKIKRIIT